MINELFGFGIRSTRHQEPEKIMTHLSHSHQQSCHSTVKLSVPLLLCSIFASSHTGFFNRLLKNSPFLLQSTLT